MLFGFNIMNKTFLFREEEKREDHSVCDAREYQEQTDQT